MGLVRDLISIVPTGSITHQEIIIKTPKILVFWNRGEILLLGGAWFGFCRQPQKNVNRKK